MATKAAVPYKTVSVISEIHLKQPEETYHKSPQQERTLENPKECWAPATTSQVRKSMSKGFKNDDAAKPSMNQIVSVKRKSQKRDKGIVSSSQQEERNLFTQSDLVSMGSAETNGLFETMVRLGDIPC